MGVLQDSSFSGGVRLIDGQLSVSKIASRVSTFPSLRQPPTRGVVIKAIGRQPWLALLKTCTSSPQSFILRLCDCDSLPKGRILALPRGFPASVARLAA